MIRTIERCSHCQSLTVDGLEVDLERVQMRFNGEVVKIEPNEAAFIYRLIHAQGRPVRVEVILTAVWGNTIDGPPDSAFKALGVYAHRLRAKLRLIKAPIVIRTIYGKSYAIEPAHPRVDTRVLRRSELTAARTAAALDEVPA